MKDAQNGIKDRVGCVMLHSKMGEEGKNEELIMGRGTGDNIMRESVFNLQCSVIRSAV
jgi:hypothetical protein